MMDFMGFTGLHFLWLITPLFVSGVAILTLFRRQRTYMTLEDHEMLRAMIRNELSTMLADAKQHQLLDEVENMIAPLKKRMR